MARRVKLYFNYIRIANVLRPAITRSYLQHRVTKRPFLPPGTAQAAEDKDFL